MGWFWGAPDDKKVEVSSDDPLRNLDPGLREFLAKESPVKYSSTNPPAKSQTPATPSPQPERHPQSVTNVPKSDAEAASKIPPQSLFQDGRYANLWVTYQPLAEVEAATKNDAEKIDDILQGYKERKAQIGRAALENCALEQWEVNECFKSGSWASVMTLCRAENKKFERCYLVQAKFLKSLGYLSIYDRPREIDERIQMHADKLYHQMIKQEEITAAAKAEGKPVPTFPPLVAPARERRKTEGDATSISDAGDFDSSKLAPAVQARLEKQLKGLSDKERQIEQQAILAEVKAAEEAAQRLNSIWEKQDEERRQRKEQGKETIGDKISSILRFR